MNSRILCFHQNSDHATSGGFVHSRNKGSTPNPHRRPDARSRRSRRSRIRLQRNSMVKNNEIRMHLGLHQGPARPSGDAGVRRQSWEIARASRCKCSPFRRRKQKHCSIARPPKAWPRDSSPSSVSKRQLRHARLPRQADAGWHCLRQATGMRGMSTEQGTSPVGSRRKANRSSRRATTTQSTHLSTRSASWWTSIPPS